MDKRGATKQQSKPGAALPAVDAAEAPAREMEDQVGHFDKSDAIFAGSSNGSGSAAAMTACTLAIVDHSRLRRECLRLALAQHNPNWRIMDCGTAEELLRGVGAGEGIDLVIIGAATAEHVDLAQLETIREALPSTPAVIVAENGNPHRARQVLNAGARGFLPTSLSLKVLMGALELVLAGGVYVPSTLLESAAANHGGIWESDDRPAEPWSELTRRQRDVLALISQGKSNKLIADALSMSESTVKAHVKQIIKRLHVSNRTQAALLATGHGPFTAPVFNGAHAGVAAFGK
jgi:DNA-binding NarL/FixJ family response regulator